MRVRAGGPGGRRSWFDAEPVYVFEGALDLAVLKIKRPPLGGFRAVIPHDGRLEQGQEVFVVRNPPFCRIDNPVVTERTCKQVRKGWHALSEDTVSLQTTISNA